MKIVNIYEREIVLPSPVRNSYFSQNAGGVIVLITDAIRHGKPVIGYGFNSIVHYTPTSTLRDRVIPRLLNANPEEYIDERNSNLDAEKIFKIVTKNEKTSGHGELAHAVGAIDMAVWDTIAKIEGVPLYKVLADRYNNGVYDTNVSTYAAGGYYYPGKGIDVLQNEMKAYLDQGFTRVKLKIGGAGLEEDLRRIEAVIKVVGTGSKVAVDANARFDLQTALKYGEVMEPYSLMWFEEPGNPLDYQLNATLCENYRGPISTGENLFSLQDAENIIRYGGLRADRDNLQFDVQLSYGIVGYLKILEMMRLHGWSPKRCDPHGGNLYCLHVAAGLQLGGSECYPGVFQPFGGFADGIPIVEGCVKLTDAPGIGFETKNNLYRFLRQAIGE
ncbi:MAG: enolase C-terminal domain-like protein [Veillonellales bacterium]